MKTAWTVISDYLSGLHDNIRHVRFGDQWFKHVEIDFYRLVDISASASGSSSIKSCPRPWAFRNSNATLVTGKDAGGGAHFDAHVGNGRSLWNGKALEPFARIFDDIANATLYGQYP